MLPCNGKGNENGEQDNPPSFNIQLKRVKKGYIYKAKDPIAIFTEENSV